MIEYAKVAAVAVLSSLLGSAFITANQVVIGGMVISAGIAFVSYVCVVRNTLVFRYRENALFNNREHYDKLPDYDTMVGQYLRFDWSDYK